MGVKFFDHLGGDRLFNCRKCKMHLTNRQEVISPHFTGSTGPAILFQRVVNVICGKVQDRIMITGRHFVRDISCKKCDSKLGWTYEFATEPSQRYKEGCFVLECALVTEFDGDTEIDNTLDYDDEETVTDDDAPNN